MKLVPTLKKEAIAILADNTFGDRLWRDVIMFVSELDDRSDLSNKEKHAKVLRNLKVIFDDVFECILNAAIDIGVMWLRAKMR